MLNPGADFLGRQEHRIVRLIPNQELSLEPATVNPPSGPLPPMIAEPVG